MPETLRAQQLAFAAHVRDPARNPAPAGIEDRRMAIYRALFSKGLEGLLATNFPVVKRTLGDDAWLSLVRAFYATHHCRTPLFPQIGAEFVEWLQLPSAPRSPRLRGDDVPPWLPELAHYEYAELALSIADAPVPPHDPDGDLLDGIPLVSPFAWPLAYAWPVHRIGPAFRPAAPGPHPTLLLLRRDAAGDVHFSTLSPATYRLLQLVDADGDRTGRALLYALAGEAAAPDPDAFLRDGATQLRHLRDDGVLLGTAPRC